MSVRAAVLSELAGSPPHVTGNLLIFNKLTKRNRTFVLPFSVTTTKKVKYTLEYSFSLLANPNGPDLEPPSILPKQIIKIVKETLFFQLSTRVVIGHALVSVTFSQYRHISPLFFVCLHSFSTFQYVYRGLPPMNSDQRRTSEGIPSGRGSFSLMHWAKSMAV